MAVKGIFLSVNPETSTIVVTSVRYSLTVKEYMKKRDASLEVIMFECDCCGAEHIIEDSEGFTLARPDDRAPKGWLFVRFGDVTAQTPLECLMCDACKVDVIASLGFENLDTYQAMLKATNSSAASQSYNTGGMFILNRGIKETNLN